VSQPFRLDRSSTGKLQTRYQQQIVEIAKGLALTCAS
jgi:hypothetical protein